MDAAFARALLLSAALVGTVGAQEPDPEPEPERTWSETIWGFIDTTGEIIWQPAKDFAESQQRFEESQNSWIYDFVDWLTSPVTSRILTWLDYVGMRQQRYVLVDLDASPILYHLRIINLWMPLYEGVAYLATMVAMLAAWIPIKVVVKYLAPGLG